MPHHVCAVHLHLLSVQTELYQVAHQFMYLIGGVICQRAIHKYLDLTDEVAEEGRK